MTIAIEFDEYNGWKNYPTWDIFTQVTSYPETSRHFERLAQGNEDIRKAVEETIDNWRRGRPNSPDVARGIVSDWFMDAVRRVDWAWVHDELIGRKVIKREQHELTVAALQFIQAYPSQEDILQGETPGAKDTALMQWTEEQLQTWIGSSEARKYQTPLTSFAKKILEIYMAVVDWEGLTAAFKEE